MLSTKSEQGATCVNKVLHTCRMQCRASTPRPDHKLDVLLHGAGAGVWGAAEGSAPADGAGEKGAGGAAAGGRRGLGQPRRRGLGAVARPPQHVARQQAQLVQPRDAVQYVAPPRPQAAPIPAACTIIFKSSPLLIYSRR